MTNKERISSIETDDVTVAMIVTTMTTAAAAAAAAAAIDGSGGNSEGSGGTAVTRKNNATIVETDVEMATKTGTTCGRIEVGWNRFHFCHIICIMKQC